MISGNFGPGVLIVGTDSKTNRVYSNLIGTDVTGTKAVPNNSDGVAIFNGSFNRIGAGFLGGNRIAGNVFNGVSISGFSSDDNQVVENIIGLGANGLPLPNGFHGIALSSSTSSNLIAGNHVAFNPQDGVAVDSSSVYNTITGNSIHDNGGLGIDLAFDGVNANDPNDPDTGANFGQNFPILSNAMVETSGTSVSGMLNSTPNTLFQIEFFANALPDSSGHGEGAQFLGSTPVLTDGSGNVSFSLTGATLDVAEGRHISATATDPDGNTSEFSRTIRADSALPGITFAVTTAADSGPGSLREVIQQSNKRVSADYNEIQFSLTGAGPHIIELLTPLPPLTEGATLNGLSQAGSLPNSGTPGNNAVHQIVLSGRLLQGNDAHGIEALAPDCSIESLKIVAFPGNGIVLRAARSFVTGCSIVSNSLDGVLIEGNEHVVGGFSFANANVVSGNGRNGVAITGTNAIANGVFRNFIGVAPDGLTEMPNGANGVLVSNAFENSIGTTIDGGNVISGNTEEGIMILGTASIHNGIVGNLIGTDATGNAPLGNGLNGISFQNAPSNNVRGCVIAANGLDGVEMSGFFSSGNRIHESRIGLGLDGKSALGNGRHGVRISGANGTYIGKVDSIGVPRPVRSESGSVRAASNGTDLGPNQIAYNGGDGILVESGTGNLFTGNSIWSNGELGIDLFFNGVNPNDGPGDFDGGPNLRQNFPTIFGVTWNGSSLVVTGELVSAANTTFNLEFFANEVADPTQHGEGRYFLGANFVTTDATGRRNFSIALPMTEIPGQVFTSTATDLNDNTSEFSRAHEGLISTAFPLTQTITTINPTGAGSAREAIETSNKHPSSGPNLINVDISGVNQPVVAVVDPFPEIRSSISFDGRNQGAPVPSQLNHLILDGTGTPSTGNGLLLVNTAEGSDLANLTIRNFADNGIVIHADDVTLQGLILDRNGGNGIQLLNTSLTTIGGDGDDIVIIDRNDRHGVAFTNANNLTIRNSVIANNSLNGLDGENGTDLLIGGNSISGHNHWSGVSQRPQHDDPKQHHFEQHDWFQP